MFVYHIQKNMKKNTNNLEDKETNELLCRLYEDCMKFKREKGKKINCNFYSNMTKPTSPERKKYIGKGYFSCNQNWLA
jgi:hypothetical protein